ncbi:hypothetical protein BVRB_8g196960 [Beta vulgaris subsp. vulgaris]|nr:hypothetical protein BVRB_8g196960 [Beta vulgaris subsp. vulgaris]
MQQQQQPDKSSIHSLYQNHSWKLRHIIALTSTSSAEKQQLTTLSKILTLDVIHKHNTIGSRY